MNALLLARARRNIDQFENELVVGEYSIQRQALLSAIFASCQSSLKNAAESIALEMSPERRQPLQHEVEQLESRFSGLSKEFASWKGRCKEHMCVNPSPTLSRPVKPQTIAGRLSNLSDQLDDQLEAGTHALAALKHQGSILKGTRSRALSMANSLGVSQKLIRWIDTRTRQDSVLFYTGMLFSVALLLFLYIYFL